METIDQTVQRLTAFIQENNPKADVAPGSVFSEQLLKTASSLQNLVKNDILALASAQSILTALATNSNVPDIIDEVASNFDVSRNTGSLATGKVMVIVASKSNYVIPAGFTLTQPALGLNYVTTADYYVVASNPSVSDLPLYSNYGIFYFILPVVAAGVGSQYSNGVTNKTLFTLAVGTVLTGFVGAQAYGGFTAGTDAETNAELITRLKLGICTRTTTTPLSIAAILADQFPSVQSIAVRGAGDNEMTRSKQHGINTFGMADVYMRSSTNLETVGVSVVPSKVTFYTAANAQARYDLIAAGSITVGDIVTETSTNKQYVLSNRSGIGEAGWLPFTVVLTPYDKSKISKCFITDADSAGFYRVTSVTDAQDNSVEVLFTGFDFSIPAGRANVVPDRAQARFTKYQTGIVLVNNLANASALTAHVEYQPYINNIQALFLNDSSRIACADYLVKAVIPCLVSCNLTVSYPSNSTPLDTSKMAQDILSYINHLSFGDSLSVSKLVGICLADGATRVKLPITLSGQMLLPDGTTGTVTSNDALTIPNTPAYLAKGVTSQTTLFFADLNSFNITVVTE